MGRTFSLFIQQKPESVGVCEPAAAVGVGLSSDGQSVSWLMDSDESQSGCSEVQVTIQKLTCCSSARTRTPIDGKVNPPVAPNVCITTWCRINDSFYFVKELAAFLFLHTRILRLNVQTHTPVCYLWLECCAVCAHSVEVVILTSIYHNVCWDQKEKSVCSGEHGCVDSAPLQHIHSVTVQ